MAVSLNTNVPSLSAQRRLSVNTSQLGSTFERLSSGLRINRAGDDAAGLAIAEQLKVDSRVSNQAIRNMNDAVSVVGIITSALESQKNILIRMSELAEQASNGVFSYRQRKPLDQEYQELMREFDRIAETASFNGQQLLRSDSGEQLSFMAGITGASSSLLSVAKADSHSMSGVAGTQSNYDGDTDVDGTDFAAYYIPMVSTSAQPEGLSEAGFALKFIDLVDSLGQRREVVAAISSFWDDFGNFTNSLPPITELDAHVFSLAADGTVTGIVGAFQSGISSSGIYTRALTFSDTGATATISVDLRDINWTHKDGPSTEYGRPLTTSGSPYSSSTFVVVKQSPVNETAIGFTSLRYQTTALRAVDTVKNRINELSLSQGIYGAMEQRLRVVADNLSVSSENFLTAASRITDADVAEQSSALVRFKILQQAGASVLAQANQQPALALQLLGT